MATLLKTISNVNSIRIIDGLGLKDLTENGNNQISFKALQILINSGCIFDGHAD